MHAKILLDYCAFTNNELRHHARSNSDHGVCILLACDSEVEPNTYFRVLFYPNSTYNLTIAYINRNPKSAYSEKFKFALIS